MEQCFSGYCRALDASRVVMADTDDGAAAVSYTHLTLPTILRV